MKKNKKRILVVGGFGYHNNSLTGQTIKTRNVYEMLKHYCDNSIVEYFDPQEVKKSVFKPFKMIMQLISCNVIIYLPAHNNLKYVFPILFLIAKLRNVPINYIVVGGWLADFLKDKPMYVKRLKNINRIYPQTQLLKCRLEKEYNFENVEYFPNFRINNFVPIPIDNRNKLRLVFMARINKLKGYETIFTFASYAKENKLDVVIDFYGQLLESDKKDFLEKIEKFDFVNYKGELNPENIYTTLSAYDILLLPTKYYTEGFPGTILDAYISGIPVIVTKWLHATEFVDENKSGFIVPFENGQEEFNNKILELYLDRDKLYKFKLNAFKKSLEYSDAKAWEIITEQI